MNNLVASIDRRRHFSVWLRTGRRPTRTADGIELKFNPYHDPRNGQFTSGPGGPSSSRGSATSRRRADLRSQRSFESVAKASPDASSDKMLGGDRIVDAVYLPDDQAGSFQNVQFRPPMGMPRGSNSRAFEDPMTLEQAAPGIRDAPGGAIISLADNVVGATAPANGLMSAITRERSTLLIDQINAIDPKWNFQSLDFPKTWDGMRNQVNDLRIQRAAAFLRVKGDLQPMQVETLRVMQDLTDRAYDRAKKAFEEGKLRGRLSKEQAIGTYIDNVVRADLRVTYKRFDLKSVSNQVRVNRREYDTSKPESSYRQPDARVGDVAFDVTLTRKDLKSPQIRGFFSADFKPSFVVIIRPRQLGIGSSYIITRPEIRK